MARYIVTSSSHFTPFTYDELAKPLQQQTDIHNAAQDAYDQMSVGASTLEEYLQREPDDSRAREMYNTYRTRLKELQDNLWDYGINAQTRKYLNEAKTGYSKNILRLQNAIETRQKASAAFWDKAHKGDDAIMGIDPGTASLDKFLENENYGNDWFSYSGNQFMKEVAIDAAARAAEFDDVKYSKEVPGYITRIRREGFSNSDADAAILAVRNGTVDQLTGAPKILADVLVSHLNSTGAKVGTNITPEQYSRLVDFGGAGLSSTVGKKTYTDLTDEVFRQRLSDSSWAWRNSITRRQQLEDREAEAAAKLELEGINQGIIGRPEDTITKKGAGENYEKARKQVKSDIGENLTQMYFTKDKKRISSNADASSIVYSEDLRRQAYETLGWDPGVTIKGPSDKMPQGVGRHNGKEYLTKYNKRKRAVEVSYDNGKNWYLSDNLTKYYNNIRKEIDSTVDYYRKNEKDIFDLAITDPDKQRDMYEREGLDFGTTRLADYADAVMGKQGNEREDVWTSTIVATRGTDKGNYIGAISDRIYSSLGKTNKGDVRRRAQDGWRNSTGTGSYLHYISPTGHISEKPIANPNDVFDIDKEDGTIKNIDQVRVDANGIKDGYVIVHLSNKNKEVAVGIEMLGSDILKAKFEDYAQLMRDDELYNPSRSPAERKANETRIANAMSKYITSVLGHIDATVGGPSSKEEDIN